MLLETERLLIRPVEEEDGKIFADMAADGSLAADVGFDQDCGAWMKDWIKKARALTDADDPSAGYLAYAVVLKEKDCVIGSVGCSYYKEFNKAGITYFIGAQYRGMGYAAEAARAYTEYFLGHYDTAELIAAIREANVPSWRTAEKAGYALVEKKLYQDINDEKEEQYRFYSRRE